MQVVCYEVQEMWNSQNVYEQHQKSSIISKNICTYFAKAKKQNMK